MTTQADFIQHDAEPTSSITAVPHHIGIIMDGNGRWAQARGMPRIAGHQAGVDNIRRILEHCVQRGVKVLTIYAFSTENWRRPPDEVSGLMRLLGLTIQRQLNELNRNGVRILHSGRMEGINKHLQKQILNALEVTKDNDRIILNVAFNYGGRAEILDAVRHIMQDGIPPETLTEEMLSSYMYIGGIPDPDLIIRTGGEWRLSNFLIWQAAYAEYYTTPTYWPDFDENELDKALIEYNQRERRFGRVLNQ
ncbi:MAG: polyprenyl diphosphate synthase [Caldilinea sp.]|uniref:polyprenyl diphosphate synthase n=1 Tax=Caldilinea sp. TaxID=2293560 RepID=UPI002CDF6082|nr:polyprenyl diphosphate synthase [Caldilinea sp.]HRA66671.1 polyprenyl diphosphate synthase [Caldilinea sp.]